MTDETKACKCAEISFSNDSDNADLIFRGILLGKQDSISIGKAFYTFKITKIWKGQSYQSLIIKTNYGGQACGASFEIDKEYLIFANNLETSRCRRNSEVSTSPDISRLDYKYIKSYRQQIATDTFPILSKQESEYFNTIVKSGIYIHGDISNSVDFTDKKIAFLDNGLISKKEYFMRYGGKGSAMHFEKFTNHEIKESGGYYGIFCMHRKMSLTKRQKRKLVKQLP